MLRLAEEANETEKNVGDEKPVGEEEAADANKETPANETEEKEAEDKVIFFNSKHSQYLFLCIHVLRWMLNAYHVECRPY